MTKSIIPTELNYANKAARNSNFAKIALCPQTNQEWLVVLKDGTI